MDAQLDERALVDEQRDALARGQRALLVLAVDLLLPPAERDPRAAGFEVLDEGAQQAGLGRGGGHGAILTAFSAMQEVKSPTAYFARGSRSFVHNGERFS